MATFKQHLYMEHFSKLMQTSRAYTSYHDFLQRSLLLTRKLLNQWFLVVKLKSSLRKVHVNGHHYDLVIRYGIYIYVIWIFDKSNRKGATRGEGTAFASGAPALIPALFFVPLCGVRVAHCLDIYVVFFRSLSFCPFSCAH